MRYPKFREFHEAKEKGLAYEKEGPPNKYKDGGKGPHVPSDWTSKSGNTPNKEKDGGKGANVGKGLADEKGTVTKDQWIPKEPKRPELIKLEKTLAGKDYKGFLATKDGNKADDETLPYEKVKDFPGVYVPDDPSTPTDGFAFDATPGLNPSNSGGEKPDLKFTKKHNFKMTSEQFIKETADLSPAEFVKFYEDATEHEPLPTVTDLYGNEFTPDPNQVIEYLAALAVRNPRLMSRLVREMKRHEGGFGSLFNETTEHPEFFESVVGNMGKGDGEGRKFCHKISRAMNDNYMDALSKFVIENNLNEEVQPKGDLNAEDGGPLGKGPDNPSGMKSPTPQGGSFGGGGPQGGGPQMGPPQGGAEGGGGVGAPQPPAPGGSFGGGSPMAGQDTGPVAPMPGMGGVGGGAPPMPPAGGGFDNGGMPGKPPGPMGKLKGETAHGNMIEEMGGFPHMHSYMSDFCINGNCKKK